MLESVFDGNPKLRSYILDDQDRLRQHVHIYINNERVADTIRLSDTIGSDDEIVRVPGPVGRIRRETMSDRLLVGTRKGLFDLRRQNGGWVVGKPAFLGQPVSMVLRDPRDKTLYAGLALGHFGTHLHRSADDGKSWTEVACPAFAKVEGADRGCRQGAERVVDLVARNRGG